MHIREIEARDNAAIENIIRTCLTEFGGNRAGLAWQDPYLSDLTTYYQAADRAYWVVEHQGKVVGGCGIAPFADSTTVCELQKMYLLPEARGTGIAETLLETALHFAAQHYEECYLETLQTMVRANRFYQKHGFQAMDAPLAGTEHYACDAWYIRSFKFDV